MLKPCVQFTISRYHHDSVLEENHYELDEDKHMGKWRLTKIGNQCGIVHGMVILKKHSILPGAMAQPLTKEWRVGILVNKG